jgi:non-ribosomal peptide synthetase component E (peptide arylation enzyme)
MTDPQSISRLLQRTLGDSPGHGEIAAYKAPTRIYFIESMPLTASGKIDHEKLYNLLPE